MHRIARMSASAAAVLALAGSARAQAEFRGLGGLTADPNPRGTAWGISGDGQVVVGDAHDGSIYRAIRWTWSGGMESLGDLPGGPFPSFALGVSPDGQTIVGSTISPLGREGFKWTQSEGMVGLGDLPGGIYRSYAWDTSNGGKRIVGQADYEFDPVVIGRAVRWDDGAAPVQIVDTYSEAIGLSPDGSVVVGYAPAPGGGTEAFRWTEAGGVELLGDLPGGDTFSFAYGVNADGSVIVGAGRGADNLHQVVRWTDAGGIEALGNLPGSMPRTEATAWACSADGSVIVGIANHSSFCGEYDESGEAFIWTEADGMRRVRDVLMLDHGVDVSGWALIAATGVSDDGTVICGHGVNPLGHYEGWVARLTGGVCRADFDGNGVLDFFDFLAFQNAFARGCP
ncbi:MAG: PEP-CTERM sorting domain-containing protein [Phycisphaerales bacterium JB039]